LHTKPNGLIVPPTGSARIDTGDVSLTVSRFFPTFRGILLERELDGDLGNFLAREEDYRFVRELHLQNRIIPVVGDFAGPKALRPIRGYLKEKGYSVSAFYTSNVE
jgi:hypothetical protein